MDWVDDLTPQDIERERIREAVRLRHTVLVGVRALLFLGKLRNQDEHYGNEELEQLADELFRAGDID